MFIAEKTFEISNIDFEFNEDDQKKMIELIELYIEEHLDPELFIKLKSIDSNIDFNDYTELLGEMIVSSFSNKDDSEEKIINDVFLKFKEVSSDITVFMLATDLNKSTKDYHITFGKSFINGIIHKAISCAVEAHKKEVISLVKIEMKNHIDSKLLNQLNDLDSGVEYSDYLKFLSNLIFIAFSNKDDSEKQKTRDVLLKLKEVIEPTIFSELVDDLGKDNEDYALKITNCFLRHLLRKNSNINK